MGDAVEDVGKASAKQGGVLGGFTNVLGKIGLAGLGVQTAFGAITGAVEGLIGPALDAQQVTAQLQSVLTSTGGKAGVTQDAVEDLSNALSKVTTFEDEAITSGQSLLLTFTNIGSDVFPQATETMLDMSQALGQDMKSSAIQLGKALNDPVKGITALSRVGVSFTEEQKKQIKVMAEAGDIAGAQALILKELETEFGGAAKAAGQTFGGQLQILRNQLGNIVETIGGPVLTVLQKLLTAVLPLVTAFGERLPGALDAFGDAMAPVVKFVETSLLPVLEAISKAVIKVFQGDFAGAVETLQTDIVPQIKEFGREVLQWLGDQIPVVARALADWAEKFVAWVGPAIPPMLQELADLGRSLLKWAGDQLPPLVKQLAEWAEAAVSWVLDAAVAILPQLGDFLVTILRWLGDNSPTLVQRFLSEFVPAAIEWVVKAAIDILPKLAYLLFKITEWILFTGVPELLNLAVKLGIAIVEGFAGGLANLAGKVGDAILNGFRNLNFDFGIFHLHNGQFTVTFPTIQLPSVSQPAGAGGSGGGGSSFSSVNLNLGQSSAVSSSPAPSPAPQQSTFGEKTESNGEVWYGEFQPGGIFVPYRRVRALGGNVQSGVPYLVGERGPELFTPRTDGYVVPNNDLPMAMAGAGAVHVHIHVAGSVVSERELADKLLTYLRKRVQNLGTWDRVLSGVGGLA